MAVQQLVIEKAGDRCQDCGHTNKCCGEQQETEAANTAEVAGFEFNLVEQRVLSSLCFREFVALKTPHGTFLNKAPPGYLPQTLLSLHQKLSV